MAFLGVLVCALAFTVSASPDGGKITGVVIDAGGVPQLGATVVVSSDALLAAASYQLLTNDRGKFSVANLAPGSYSISRPTRARGA